MQCFFQAYVVASFVAIYTDVNANNPYADIRLYNKRRLPQCFAPVRHGDRQSMVIVGGAVLDRIFLALASVDENEERYQIRTRKHFSIK